MKDLNCYVIRTGPPYHELLLRALKKDIPQQQVHHIALEDIENIKSKIKFVPIFGDYYLVMIDYKRKKEMHQFFKWCSDYSFIKLVVLCNTNDNYLSAISHCEKNYDEVFKYDSYKAIKEDRTEYIIKTLREYNHNIKLTIQLVEAIRKRLWGYSSEVNGFLQRVATTNNLTKKELYKIIPKKETLNSATFGFMCYDNCSISKLDKVIYNYRFYPYSLVDSLLKYTDKIYKLYPEMLAGNFTEMNYQEFIANSGSKYGCNNEFSAQKILEIFNTMSYYKIVLVKNMLEECGKYNRSKIIVTLYKVIRIIQG